MASKHVIPLTEDTRETWIDFLENHVPGVTSDDVHAGSDIEYDAHSRTLVLTCFSLYRPEPTLDNLHPKLAKRHRLNGRPVLQRKTFKADTPLPEELLRGL